MIQNVSLGLFLMLAQVGHASIGKATFKTPNVTELKGLVEFAIQSNDVYKTRKVSREIAVQVFELQPYQVEEGLIEKLVDEAGNTLGFYSLKKPSRDKAGKIEIELGHVFVKPGYMRRGLGTLLFERACSRAKSLGVARMYWISDPDAKDFYLKKGARLIGHDDNLLNPAVKVPLFELIFRSVLPVGKSSLEHHRYS